MKRTHVISSNLQSVGYDQVSRILEVEFNNGTIYQYFDVPVDKYLALLSAPSKGSYFSQFIKDVYHCIKVK